MSYIALEKKSFREPTISHLRDFIIRHSLSSTDSISLPEQVFDELALDYRQIYQEPMPNPFCFLGVWVKTADQSLNPGRAIINHDDPFPNEGQSIIPEKVYRCGYCGCHIDEYGRGLSEEELKLIKEQIKNNKQFPTSVCSSCKR